MHRETSTSRSEQNRAWLCMVTNQHVVCHSLRVQVKWPNGIEYDGEWKVQLEYVLNVMCRDHVLGSGKDGIREGKGKLTWADGSCYKGVDFE